MDSEPLDMTFYDSFGGFKSILGDFDFVGFLYTQTPPYKAAQYLRTSKILIKHQKYVKIRVYFIKMQETGVKKRSKDRFRVPRSFL